MFGYHAMVLFLGISFTYILVHLLHVACGLRLDMKSLRWILWQQFEH